MRQDQYEKLQKLSETLLDIAFDELDHTKWPGATMPIDQHDAKIRGDRYWFKKNGVATLAVVTRIANLTKLVQLDTNRDNGALQVAEPADTLDEEISATEKEAQQLINRLNNREALKEVFDKKVHGR